MAEEMTTAKVEVLITVEETGQWLVATVKLTDPVHGVRFKILGTVPSAITDESPHALAVWRKAMRAYAEDEIQQLLKQTGGKILMRSTPAEDN
jgi:hypothetical protein